MSVERVIEIAEQHGVESEPDHEVGDLQEALRILWKHLPLPQRQSFCTDPSLADLLTNAGASPEDIAALQRSA